jgi:hypothetical protein
MPFNVVFIGLKGKQAPRGLLNKGINSIHDGFVGVRISASNFGRRQ